MLEDIRCEHHVERLAGHVDNSAANHAQDKIKHDRNEHPNRERNKRSYRAIWNHTVVDIHDEQWRGQR